jgi:hypothetical protein
MNTKTNDQIIRREIAARIGPMKAELERLREIRDALGIQANNIIDRISILHRDIAIEIASAPPVQVKPSKR